MPVLKRKTNQPAGLKKKIKMKKEKEKTKMFKSILTYVAAKKVFTCVVLASMLIGVMAVACVAAVFAPKASAEEMNPYAGKTFEMYDAKVGTYQLTVTDDGKALVKFPDNDRVGYYYDVYVGDNGELLVVDGNNTVFSASMNDNGTLSDYDGDTWFDCD